MDKVTEIWEVYRASWNNENQVDRKLGLGQIMTDDFEYCDPNIKLKGSDRLSDYMDKFQKEFFGASFIVTDFHLHHDRSLAHWNMVNSKNEVIAKGIDFAQYQDGVLKHITGFFEEN